MSDKMILWIMIPTLTLAISSGFWFGIENQKKRNRKRFEVIQKLDERFKDLTYEEYVLVRDLVVIGVDE